MVRAATLQGTVELSQRDIDDLDRGLGGRLMAAEAADYDEVRRVWNRMIDRRPALVVRPANGADVVRAVQFARAHDLLVSVRGGGHNVTGNAVCDGGLMIDLSTLRTAQVDAGRRRLFAEPGLTWLDFDVAAQRHGLASTGGIVSTTGIAGLTLGGGHGWLTRKHGLTCDNLLAADVVTAEGTLLRASAEENGELFWALRGGGGNFGVVTAFEYALYPLEGVWAGLLLYPLTRAKEVLALYFTCAAEAPDELALYIIITTWGDGTPVIALVPCYSGPQAQGERVLREVRRVKNPLLDTVRPVSYGELQTMFDATNPPGNWYYKTGYLDERRLAGDAFADALLAQCDFPSPSPLSRIVIEHLGGAMARQPADATAFPHRQAAFDLIFIAGGFALADKEKNVAWGRRAWEAMRPFMSGGAYVNYLDGDAGAEEVRSAYGPTYERLVALKERYDPTNFFRLNQNIGRVARPARR